jgi:hypothetical protein
LSIIERKEEFAGCYVRIEIGDQFLAGRSTSTSEVVVAISGNLSVVAFKKIDN